jgi:hypothetical protein
MVQKKGTSYSKNFCRRETVLSWYEFLKSSLCRYLLELCREGFFLVENVSFMGDEGAESQDLFSRKRCSDWMPDYRHSPPCHSHIFLWEISWKLVPGSAAARAFCRYLTPCSALQCDWLVCTCNSATFLFQSCPRTKYKRRRGKLYLVFLCFCRTCK